MTQDTSRLDRAIAVLDALGESKTLSQQVSAGVYSLSGFVLTGAADDVRHSLESLALKYNALVRRSQTEASELPVELNDEDSRELVHELRHVASWIRDLEIKRILSRFHSHDNVLPRAEIMEARRHQKDIVPALIKACNEQIDRLSMLDIVDERLPDELCCSVPFISFFLFAEWEVVDSVPTILKGLRLPGEAPFVLFGDAVHEQTPRYLAQFLSEDLDQIDAIIKDRHANTYVRWSSASSYKFLVRDRKLSVEDAVVRLDRLFHETKIVGDDGRPSKEHCYVLSAGIVDVIDSIGGLSATTISLEDRDWRFVDDSIICRDDLLQQANSTGDRDTTESLQRLPPTRVIDCLEELASWAAFNPEPMRNSRQRPSTLSLVERRTPDFSPLQTEPLPTWIRTPIQKAAKIPRNAACPCGSGRKYKQCCLRKAKDDPETPL